MTDDERETFLNSWGIADKSTKTFTPADQLLKPCPCLSELRIFFRNAKFLSVFRIDQKLKSWSEVLMKDYIAMTAPFLVSHFQFEIIAINAKNTLQSLKRGQTFYARVLAAVAYTQKHIVVILAYTEQKFDNSR